MSSRAAKDGIPERVSLDRSARGAGEGESREGRESGREDKRKQILKAAVKVFAEKGYHGCRISDVAEEAGVAYGLVYHYFGNKEGLLRTIFDTNWAIFVNALEEIEKRPVSSREKIRKVTDFLFDVFEAAPLIVKVLVVEFGRSQRLGLTLDRPDVDRAFKALTRIYDEARKSGELREGVDARAMSLIYMGSMEAALASFVVESSESSVAAAYTVEAMKKTLLASFCEGIFEDTPDGAPRA